MISTTCRIFSLCHRDSLLTLSLCCYTQPAVPTPEASVQPHVPSTNPPHLPPVPTRTTPRPPPRPTLRPTPRTIPKTTPRPQVDTTITEPNVIASTAGRPVQRTTKPPARTTTAQTRTTSVKSKTFQTTIETPVTSTGKFQHGVFYCILDDCSQIA